MKMQPMLSSSRHVPSSRPFRLFLILSTMFALYLVVLIFVVITPKNMLLCSSKQGLTSPTSLDQVVFGIVSSQKSWPVSRELVKLWWQPGQMRGCVFLESIPEAWDSNNDTDSLPSLCISGDTSRFWFGHHGSWAIRAARVVSDVMTLNQSDVRWYVFGDDDTIFFPNNLVKTLSKYDYKLWHYIGASSENLEQNRVFGFDMAFGGAGFAISSSLARVLSKVLDSCLERYPHLYGGDSRVYSCIAELGIGMTHEPGFHQFDVRGDAFGLLASHPITPLVSIHNLQSIDPIFPTRTTQEALEHLLEAAKADPGRILQQTICYDRWFSWTISVSWGYAVQIFPRHLSLPDATRVQETFKHWKKGSILGESYILNTKPLHPDPCGRSTVFFFDQVQLEHGRIKSTYKKLPDNCPYNMASPKYIEEIRVYSNKMDQQLQARRRHCCDLLPSSNNKVIDIDIRQCKEEELIYHHM